MSDELPWCQIYDLDGTLAIRGERDPYDWDRVEEDKVNQPVFFIQRNTIRNAFEEHCFIFTGRPERCRSKTLEWLFKNNLIQGRIPPEVYMRKDNDYRDDVIVKEEMYNEQIKGKYRVRFVVDDRPKVCRMWRSLGLHVFQVGNPDVEF